MPIGLGASLGIGGGRSATSSGASAGGGVPFANELSVSFDGSNDYLWVGSASELDLTGDFTLSLWVKADSWPAVGSFLLAKRDWVGAAHINYQLVIYNQLVYIVTSTAGGGNFASTSTLSTGTWYNIVVTVNPGTEGKIYINGSLDKTASIAAVQKAATPLAIGAWTDNTSLYGPHDGLLDEVAIFDSLLSVSDVASIYNGGSGVTNLASLGPVGWWRMGDNNPASAGSSVPLVTDVVNGNNATQSTGANQPVLSTDVP
jgi:hypothetical protein